MTKERRLQKVEKETGVTESGEDVEVITVNLDESGQVVSTRETHSRKEMQEKFPDWNMEEQPIKVNWTPMTDEEVQEIRRKQQERK